MEGCAFKSAPAGSIPAGVFIWIPSISALSAWALQACDSARLIATASAGVFGKGGDSKENS